MPNILDDIIASVVENKIPASRQNLTSKMSLKQEPVMLSNNSSPSSGAPEDTKVEKKKSITSAEEFTNQYPDIPHSWLNNRRLLWLKDHRNQSNWKLFKNSWKQGQVCNRLRVSKSLEQRCANVLLFLIIACARVRDP